MNLLHFLGRKFSLGFVVLAFITAIFLLRGDAENFGRYADFCEMAFGLFVAGNVGEHLFKKGK